MTTTRYWLFKSEPSTYSFDDLERDQTTFWDGIRNYQARNFMRDDMRKGDGVLFYHSNAEPPTIVGLARVVREAYPDFTQLDPKNPHYDPQAAVDDPRWFMVDIEFVAHFARPLTLPELKANPDLDGMMLLKKGQRLSIQPIAPEHWQLICALGNPH